VLIVRAGFSRSRDQVLIVFHGRVEKRAQVVSVSHGRAEKRAQVQIWRAWVFNVAISGADLASLGFQPGDLKC